MRVALIFVLASIGFYLFLLFSLLGAIPGAVQAVMLP